LQLVQDGRFRFDAESARSHLTRFSEEAFIERVRLLVDSFARLLPGSAPNRHELSVYSLSGSGARPAILVIRRDNIGDLVCTTPLITALRERYPDAHIAALVNTYNEAVLPGIPPWIPFTPMKKESTAAGSVHCSIYADRLRLVMELRKKKFDYAILATPGFAPRSLRLARMIARGTCLAMPSPVEIILVLTSRCRMTEPQWRTRWNRCSGCSRRWVSTVRRPRPGVSRRRRTP